MNKNFEKAIRRIEASLQGEELEKFQQLMSSHRNVAFDGFLMLTPEEQLEAMELSTRSMIQHNPEVARLFLASSSFLGDMTRDLQEAPSKGKASIQR